jgi:hypothetical protein
MLVVETDEGYRIVAQTEHATLAGRFADRWGNERFEVPRPNAAARAASHVHDNGWATWDLYPHLAADGTPIDLFEVPSDDWRRFYERGIDAAVAVDPYAGLLVSMHGVGVRRRRYGTVPSMPDRSDEYAAFVDSEEARQRRLAADLRDSDRYGSHVGDDAVAMLETLHETGSYDGDDPVWLNYCRLQFWDRLALYFAREPSLDATTIGPVPRAAGEWVDVAVEPVDATTVALDPYPFDTDPLTARLRERTIPGGTYENEADIHEAYYEADLETATVTLTR